MKTELTHQRSKRVPENLNSMILQEYTSIMDGVLYMYLVM